jgi:hypothetical protein
MISPLPPRTAISLLALSAAACSAVSTAVGGVTGANKEQKAQSELRQLQQTVMRFADDYASVVFQAASVIEAKTPEARLAVIGWKLRQGTAAYTIASGPNPVGSAVDMVVLTALSRSVVERYWVPEVFGESGRTLLDALGRLEPRAWDLVSGQFKPEGQAEMRKFIDQWIARNPDVREVSFIRLLDLAEGTGKGGLPALGAPSDVLGAIGLDPFAKLDPAVRQVEETRILGERALYFAERWPFLLDLQAQQLALELSLQPASQRLLDDAGRISRAAEALGGVAAGLPDLVDREREAAIRQFMDALQSQEGRARALLVQLRKTLDSGTAAATSVQGAIRSLDAFVATVSAPSPPGNPPSKPFDVNDYGRALEHLGKAAGELRSLVDSLDRDAPRVEALLGRTARQASDQGRALVDHLFWRATALVAILLAGILVVALAYRWAAARVGPRGGSGRGAA